MSKSLIVNLPGKKGRLVYSPDRGDAKTLADEVFGTNLTATVTRADGAREVYDLGSGTITTAGVLYLAGDWVSGSNDISLFKYMASGTDATASGTANTALGTPIGTTASTATLTLGTTSGNATVTAVATITYAAPASVTEWALINNATISGATVWDRKTFASIGVSASDSIQWTYVLTVSSGG